MSLVEELHAGQERLGKTAQHAVALCGLPGNALWGRLASSWPGRTDPPSTRSPARPPGASWRRSGIIDVRIKQNGCSGPDSVARHGRQCMSLGLQFFLETETGPASGRAPGACRTCRRPWSRVSCQTWCRKQTRGEITARRQPSPRAGGRRRHGAHAVEQKALIVAVDPVDIDLQNAGVLDQLQPGQQLASCLPIDALGEARLDAAQRRKRLILGDGQKRIETFPHRQWRGTPSCGSSIPHGPSAWPG